MSIDEHKFHDFCISNADGNEHVVTVDFYKHTNYMEISKDDAYALAKHFGLVDEWVSVDDRLPEMLHNGQSETVLAYNGSWWPARIENTGIGTRWFDTVDFDVLCRVTHWKPLPQPPKEQAK